MTAELTEATYLENLIRSEQAALHLSELKENSNRLTATKPRFWYLLWPLLFLVPSTAIFSIMTIWLLSAGLIDFVEVMGGLLVILWAISAMGVIGSAGYLAVDYDTAKKAPAKVKSLSEANTVSRERIASLTAQLEVEKAAASRRRDHKEPDIEKLVGQLQAQQKLVELNRDLIAREGRHLAHARFRRLLPALIPLVAFATVLAAMAWLLATLGFDGFIGVAVGSLIGITLIALAGTVVSGVVLWCLNDWFVKAPALITKYKAAGAEAELALTTLRAKLEATRTPQRGYK